MRLMETPQRLGWGSFLLAHMYHEMHEIVYRDGWSMVASVYILQVWAWEHLPICRSVVDDSREIEQPIIYRYADYIMQPHLGKTDFWQRQLDNLIAIVWRPYRGLEPWDDWRLVRKDLFDMRPLIGRSQTIVDQFIISQVMRQYGWPQGFS